MSPDPFSLVTPDERSEIRGPSRPWQHGPRLARLRRLAGVTTEDVLHWVSSVRGAPPGSCRGRNLLQRPDHEHPSKPRMRPRPPDFDGARTPIPALQVCL